MTVRLRLSGRGATAIVALIQIAGAIALTTAASTRAGEPGAEGFLFTRLAGDARGAALGGAVDPLAEGLAAPAANPAGLALRRERAVADTVVLRPLGFVGDSIGVVWPAGEGGVAGTVSFLHHDALPVTTEELPDGSGGLAGILGVEVEITGAQWLNEERAFGLSLRVLREELGERRTAAGAADAGMVWAVSPDLSAGAAVRGVGRVIADSAVRDPFPLSVLAGARYEVPDWPARGFAAVDWAPSGPAGAAAGVEAGELAGFLLRGSVAVRQDSSARLAGGAGFRGGLWSFDYAYVPVPLLGGAHVLTVSLKLGRP